MDAHIAGLLLSTLSPDASVRTQAEAGLDDAQKHGGGLQPVYALEYRGTENDDAEAGLSLTRICLAQDADLSLRQSAGINLKNYVKTRWSAAFESFKGNPPDHATKDQIRQAVFSGLSDANRKIRLACANVVSEIASSDWPDEWPNLLDSLVGLLGSGGADSVHGAMRVLTDFVSSDLSEDQLLPLANTILPQLLQVLGDEQRHSAVTRAQAVSVFNQCLTTLYMVKESHPQAATYASTQVLPQWIQAFQHLLSVDPAATGRWDSLYVINEIFQVLSTTLVSFPKTLNDSLESLLLNAVRLLTSLTVPFRATHLNDELDSDFSLDAEDSSPLSLPVIASNIFLFITSASKRASARAAFIQPEGKQPTDLFRQLIYLAFFFARVTSEDAETWSTDVNAFVADEDDELPAATVRTASLDLVSAFAMSHKQATLSVLPQAVQKSVQEAERMQAEARADWWKAVESSLVHLASLADDLEDTDFTAATGGLDDHFNLQAVFQKLVVPYLERLDLPFLQGRAIIFASRFAKQLPGNIQQQFFQAALQAFESQFTGLVTKISALRALKNYCREIPDSPAFADICPQITRDLLPLVAHANEATLILVLETLLRTIELPPVQQDANLCHSLAEAILQPVINGSTRDPLLSATLADLFRRFAAIPAQHVNESLSHQVLPKLAEMLSMPENDETRPQIDSSIVMLNSTLDGRPTPLGTAIVAAILPALFSILRNTEDDSVLQEGLECLTYVVRKDIDQLQQWHDSDGQNGLAALFDIVARVLDPQRSESGGLFVGDLLLHVFRRAGQQILPILPDLLQALVTRLSTAVTATFSQSLILPFAYLIGSQADVVLNLLESISIDGRSGSQILLNAWCDNAEYFQGFWNNRVSTYALSRLLLLPSPSLDNLQVRGDLIMQKGQGILTRSRSKKNPDQYTSMPFRAKALKIVIKELEQSTSPTSADGPVADDEDGEDGDGWEDDEAAEAAREALDISHFLGGDASFLRDDGDDENEEEDSDLKEDPIHAMDMPKHLADTLRLMATQDRQRFEACAQHLNGSELHTLHSI